jgi:hypothetical protein
MKELGVIGAFQQATPPRGAASPDAGLLRTKTNRLAQTAQPINDASPWLRVGIVPQVQPSAAADDAAASDGDQPSQCLAMLGRSNSEVQAIVHGRSFVVKATAGYPGVRREQGIRVE